MNNTDLYIEPCNSACSFCFLNYVDVLSENYIFKGLSLKEIGVLIRSIHYQVKEYKKNDMVAGEGDKLTQLLLVVKGSLIGEMMDFDGKVLQVEIIKAPETVGSVFIFGDNNRLPVNIIAAEPTKMLIIQKHDLLELFKNESRIMQNFLDIQATKSQKLSKKIKLLALQTIKGRIAFYLLNLMKKQDSLCLEIPNTQNELAEMFGVARPSLSRALRQMNDDMILNVKGKKIEILNKTELSSLLK